MPHLNLPALIARLRDAGIDNAGTDARLIVAHVLRCDRATLLAHPDAELTDAQEQEVQNLIHRRCTHEPVSRLTNRRAFWGLDFDLNEATLDPRADSETLIETTQKLCATPPRRILDLGTGSGCLLIALLSLFPEATGLGIDQAPRAVEQAQRNAERLGFMSRALFQTGDWLNGLNERFDLIVSNPPYIPSSDIAGLMPEVRNYDPLAALDGGADGLDPYRILSPRLKDFLTPDGLVLFEVGIGQANSVSDFLRREKFSPIALHNDLGGIARCVSGFRPRDI